MLMKSIGNKHKPYQNQKGQSQYLQGWVALDKCCYLSSKNQHYYKRYHYCQYHYYEIFRHPDSGKNGVERKYNIQQPDLNNNRQKAFLRLLLHSLLIVHLSSPINLVMNFTCTFPDKKKPPHKKYQITASGYKSKTSNMGLVNPIIQVIPSSIRILKSMLAQFPQS